MNRKNFIKKSLIASLAGGLLPAAAKAKETTTSKSTYDKLMEQVGFNHLPNHKNISTMNTVLHKANTRGHANHGWLNSHHSFSFANYHNPDRMNFGVLRVLNDDIVAPARGFGRHPHDNMEIISIPLSGDLEHQDSMGNTTVIKEGDIQIMSAGTGVQHSEFNKNKDQEVRFLQIWVFPKERNIQPNYSQISLKDIEKKNEFYQVLSPSKDDQGVYAHQDAWFHLGKFDKTSCTNYKVKKPGNGVYAFVLDGEATVAGQALEKRDGFGIWEVEDFEIEAKEGSRVLLMEVPMDLG
ncbi:MAG: pirin family protein [Saprospiraceae bacterium]